MSERVWANVTEFTITDVVSEDGVCAYTATGGHRDKEYKGSNKPTKRECVELVFQVPVSMTTNLQWNVGDAFVLGVEEQKKKSHICGSGNTVKDDVDMDECHATEGAASNLMTPKLVICGQRLLTWKSKDSIHDHGDEHDLNNQHSLLYSCGGLWLHLSAAKGHREFECLSYDADGAERTFWFASSASRTKKHKRATA